MVILQAIMRKLYFLLLFTLVGCSPLHTGDLLFHVVSQGNAITDVTPGMIDHVAIVMSPDSVIEAIGKGVKTTPIDSLRQQDGYYLMARVKGADSKQSLRNALYSYRLSTSMASASSPLSPCRFMMPQGASPTTGASSMPSTN